MATSESRPEPFDHETVLVVGLGKSGLASTAALRERGSRVVATDEKPVAELRSQIAGIEAKGASFAAPAELRDRLAQITLAVLSPGVPPSSVVATMIRAAGIPAIGEVELASRLCAAPIIAITGTKGKSTTAALVTHLMRESGKDARLGGNIGEPLVNAVEGATASSWVIAELSSFQLESIVALQPRISVILNIAPDHLDRYASIDEYAQAKYRIFSNQGAGDAIVLDRDDPRLRALEAHFVASGCEARRLWYTLGEPTDGVAMAVRESQVIFTPEKDAPIALFERSDITLLGEHNLRNAMAASLAALRAGCAPDAIRKALRSFVGLHHRLERVAEIDGVLYVDDSKATNPAAASAALRVFDRPVVLIAGGLAKGTDFGELGTEIRRRAKAVIAIGEAAPLLAEVSGETPFSTASSMDDAVERAREIAEPGDVVLLAPACASFDMFRDAEDRGDRYVRAVESIAEAARA